MKTLILAGTTTAVLFTFLISLTSCERPPMDSKQQGYRGTGMVQIENPRIRAAKLAAIPAVPDTGATLPAEGPKAKDVYQNVKVLGDLSVAEFARTMTAITAWVAPQQGCTYCHSANLADDSMYTKVVSRRMIEMTRHVNADWGKHVGETGVTCYTCHRGNNQPQHTWFKAVPGKNSRVGVGMGDDAGQNKGVPSIGSMSLPYDPFSGYLAGGPDGADGIRVQGTTALPTGNRMSIKQAEFTYSLMNHMSLSLGQNCTFCHNTQSFLSWNAKRVTAWHGIRMARDLNTAYLEPLTKTFPAAELGPGGDVAKINCATCHQGVNKPLAGLAMAKGFPGLVPVAATGTTAAAAPSLPPPVAEAKRAVLYFAVGSPALDAKQQDAMSQLIGALKADAKSGATISGFHSASGTLAQNQELAKQRAFAVRDALKTAGIAEARIKLEKPQQTEANVAGEDASARRVEVTVR